MIVLSKIIIVISALISVIGPLNFNVSPDRCQHRHRHLHWWRHRYHRLCPCHRWHSNRCRDPWRRCPPATPRRYRRASRTFCRNVRTPPVVHLHIQNNTQKEKEKSPLIFTVDFFLQILFSFFPSCPTLVVFFILFHNQPRDTRYW